MFLIDIETLRERGFQVCARRRWPMAPVYRMGYTTTEAVELCEALRGKRGDPVKEAGDLLMCALVSIPATIDLRDVVRELDKKTEWLMTASQYNGEDREGE